MKTNINAKHYEVSEEFRRYLDQKLTKLQRYVPRHARRSLHADVHLAEEQGRGTNPFECEVILHLPHGEIVAKEATINMFAAVDIVEAKMKNQLLRYKEKAEEHDAYRFRVWRRLRRKEERI